MSPRNISCIAQSLWECVTHVYYINVFHVKSHTGNPLNEFVDSICTVVSKRQISCAHIDPHVIIAQHAAVLKWLFLSAAEDARIRSACFLFFILHRDVAIRMRDQMGH